MDAVEYLKELKRVCNSFESCKECRQSIYAGSICVLSDLKDEKMAVEIVEKWAKEHPVKTRTTKLLEDFPNVNVSNGFPEICPCCLEPSYEVKCRGLPRCEDCEREYWTEEIE